MRLTALVVALVGLDLGRASWAGPVEEIFPTITSCYLRDYSADHLAKHPDQTVTRIAVGPDLDTWVEGPFPNIRVGVLFRDGVVGSEPAFCRAEGAGLFCVMDAELGTYTLTSTPDGVRLDVGRDGMRFEFAAGGDAVGQVIISGTSGDDRVFNIPAVNSSGCP
jgi:hypothetical protein